MRAVSAFFVLLLSPAVAFAEIKDQTLFGQSQDLYGPKPSALTFSLFSGGYFQGFEQNLVTSSERLRNRWSYGAKLGWSFTENIEADINLTRCMTLTFGGGNQNVYIYGIDLTGNLPLLSGHFVPFLSAGPAGITWAPDNGVTRNSFAVTYGAGLKWFMFKSLALVPQVRALSSFKPADTSVTAMLGLEYYVQMSSPVDTDGDGITDKLDKCPKERETKNGYQDNDGCPDTLPDGDQDGIPDGMDKCPDQPESMNGYQDDDGCPDTLPDRDHDGIPDNIDKCPDQPETANGFQDEDGCPDSMPDRDGDGILDNVDKCPDQPETKNGYKDDDGCPDKESDEFQGPIEGIYFESGSSVIDKKSYDKLNRSIAFLKKYSDVEIVIEGHTDPTGTLKFNQWLSKQRAESVRQYLTHEKIARKRISTVGLAFTHPVADNATEAGRAQNRRIEFKIVNPEALHGN